MPCPKNHEPVKDVQIRWLINRGNEVATLQAQNTQLKIAKENAEFNSYVCMFLTLVMFFLLIVKKLRLSTHKSIEIVLEEKNENKS